MSANTQVAVVDPDAPVPLVPVERCAMCAMELMDQAGPYKLSGSARCPVCYNFAGLHIRTPEERLLPRATTAQAPAPARVEDSAMALLAQQQSEKDHPWLQPVRIQREAVASFAANRDKFKEASMETMRRKVEGGTFPVELVVEANIAGDHFTKEQVAYLGSLISHPDAIQQRIMVNNKFVLEKADPLFLLMFGVAAVGIRVPLFADPKLTDANARIMTDYGECRPPAVADHATSLLFLLLQWLDECRPPRIADLAARALFRRLQWPDECRPPGVTDHARGPLFRWLQWPDDPQPPRVADLARDPLFRWLPRR